MFEYGCYGSKRRVCSGNLPFSHTHKKPNFTRLTHGIFPILYPQEAVKAAKRGSVKEKVVADKKKKQLERMKEQLKKLELQETDRDENKTIALGTSKLNYLDPRISVAW